VPVSNDPVSNTGGGLSPDYGSTLDELNPADIESVNVLKGQRPQLYMDQELPMVRW